MTDTEWYNGFSEALSGLGRAYFFIKDIFEDFLDVLFDYPILTIFLAVSVFITVLWFVVNFYIDFVNDFDYFADTGSDYSAQLKRYKKREKKRQKNKYPEGDRYDGRVLADLYFDQHKKATYFNYAGKTYYNTKYLDMIYHNPFSRRRVAEENPDGNLVWNENTNSYEVKKKKRLFRRNNS